MCKFERFVTIFAVRAEERPSETRSAATRSENLAMISIVLVHFMATWCSLLPVPPIISRRSVLSGALVSTVALLDVPAIAVDTPAPSLDITKAFLEEAQRPSSSGSTNGKINGIDATMVSSEDAEKLKQAAATIPDPDIPAGSDLERMLNGDGAVGRSVANPLAHGN